MREFKNRQDENGNIYLAISIHPLADDIGTNAVSLLSIWSQFD